MGLVRGMQRHMHAGQQYPPGRRGHKLRKSFVLPVLLFGLLSAVWFFLPGRGARLLLTLATAAGSTGMLIHQGVRHPLRSIAPDRYDPLRATRRMCLVLLLFAALSGFILMLPEMITIFPSQTQEWLIDRLGDQILPRR